MLGASCTGSQYGWSTAIASTQVPAARLWQLVMDRYATDIRTNLPNTVPRMYDPLFGYTVLLSLFSHSVTSSSQAWRIV